MSNPERKLSAKELNYLIVLAQFLAMCDCKGWGENPLTFIYNLEKQPHERVTVEQFLDLLNSGDVSLPDFAYLVKAVKGDRVFD
jgi:hypothetical protein